MYSWHKKLLVIKRRSLVSVGVILGVVDGSCVGSWDGLKVGSTEGVSDGSCVGLSEGTLVGNLAGFEDGSIVGNHVGDREG